MTNNDHITFINYINNHYDELKYKFYNFCKEKHYAFDEDIFQDTIIKCYTAIQKKGGLNDTSDYGIESYFFISFKLNIKREGQYARNQKRDCNITSDNVNDLYEEWYNTNNVSGSEKLKNDLFIDFATLYILTKVEENFDKEHFYLFRIKYLCKDMTYKKLAEKTGIKAARQKVIVVKNWLQDNVTKEEIKEAFNLMYKDLIN